MMFTMTEIAYIASQRLGRMATLQPGGAVQVNPVTVYYNALLDTLDIGGANMAGSQKFRNIRANATVSVVVDDIPSRQPLRVRCLEIRGRGEALDDPRDSAFHQPGPIIRIHPRRIISFGVDPHAGKRNVPDGSAVT